MLNILTTLNNEKYKIIALLIFLGGIAFSAAKIKDYFDTNKIVNIDNKISQMQTIIQNQNTIIQQNQQKLDDLSKKTQQKVIIVKPSQELAKTSKDKAEVSMDNLQKQLPNIPAIPEMRKDVDKAFNDYDIALANTSDALAASMDEASQAKTVISDQTKEIGNYKELDKIKTDENIALKDEVKTQTTRKKIYRGATILEGVALIIKFLL